jgi:tRNA nucleotidyltransferase (CCA-adding enzyme)
MQRHGESHNDPTARWEHFSHAADVGVRGIAATLEGAFEQAARALTAVVSDLSSVTAQTSVDIHCNGADRELLLFDWLNALVFEMATRHLLFSQFAVHIGERELHATARGEPIDVSRHQPRVEIKGATFTELSVTRGGDGLWHAQCVLDV